MQEAWWKSSTFPQESIQKVNDVEIFDHKKFYLYTPKKENVAHLLSGRNLSLEIAFAFALSFCHRPVTSSIAIKFYYYYYMPTGVFVLAL